jgi:hypothetical protein
MNDGDSKFFFLDSAMENTVHTSLKRRGRHNGSTKGTSCLMSATVPNVDIALASVARGWRSSLSALLRTSLMCSVSPTTILGSVEASLAAESAASCSLAA